MRVGFMFILLLAAEFANAMTVRSKVDLRLWQTVFDRTSPLAWNWETGSDAATVTFSNRLTGVTNAQTVGREADATRGYLPQPAIPATDETFLNVIVVQTAKGAEVSRAAADLVYAPGAVGLPIAVRTKARRDWYRVRSPRLAGFDAAWWNVAGPSGYEVLWVTPPGPHRVAREFEGVGVTDEVTLKFGVPAFLLMLR